MYSLILAYDGTRYFGWQKTKTGPTVQEALARAIERVSQEKIMPEAASRTDRGVHAEGQSVAFTLKKQWEPERLRRALNAALPGDIRVRSVEAVPASFHPTLHAKGKEYHYRLCRGAVQEPHFRLYSWHFRFPLDLLLMKKAAASLLGAHDFSAFANEAKENPVCSLFSIDIAPLERERLQISFRGDRFLYKMARNLAGTLLYIGCGKLPPDCLPELLSSRDRKKGGVTAPPHALFLHRVEY
jgi:tRNA pseudouridine38-40 synthase